MDIILKNQALESQKQTSQGYNLDLSKDQTREKDTNRGGVHASINTTSLRDSQKVYSDLNVRASTEGKAANSRYGIDVKSPTGAGTNPSNLEPHFLRNSGGERAIKERQVSTKKSIRLTS